MVGSPFYAGIRRDSQVFDLLSPGDDASSPDARKSSAERRRQVPLAVVNLEFHDGYLALRSPARITAPRVSKTFDRSSKSCLLGAL
ncbi:hypothetical protein Trydic_g17264 [Trypoxylus dichotomus]